ncbi:MAG: type I methionyl aminopeptidase [Bacteroidota bacterium]|nr:type I methionyl aminopeptidase [Bacteroidota bacterium]
MIMLKTNKDIDGIRESSSLLVRTHAEIAKFIKPGVSSDFLDKTAEEFIRDNGGVPAFKGYNNFPNTLCVSPNDEVVHGLPNNEKIKSGTILSIDCGVIKNGYFSDCAFTYEVGEVSNEKKQLLEVTRKCLDLAVAAVNVGGYIGDIGFTIQNYAEFFGFSVVRELVGHGVGFNLHEAPEVPNYGKKGEGVLIKPGLVLAIEPMINYGDKEIVSLDDGWTIKTKDGKPSAHFEYTVAITDKGVEILSPFNLIDESLNK